MDSKEKALKSSDLRAFLFSDQFSHIFINNKYHYRLPNISDLTYKMVAYSEAPKFETDECVDWAFKKSLEELKLEPMTGDQGIIAYSSYFVRKLAKAENVKENLTRIYEYCRVKDYEKNVFDFYLLYWAWDDLDNGINPQHYWPEANPRNIVQIVFTTAQKWLSQNESSLKLQ